MNSTSKTVARSSLAVVPIAIASRGAAFLIPIFVALWFGIDAVTDAWFWALAFPTFAVVLSGSAVATTVIPTLASLRCSAPHKLGREIGSLMVWTGTFSLVLGLIFCLTAPWVLDNFTRFDIDTRELACSFLWQLLPFMVINCVSVILRAGCEVHGHFKRVAVSPMLRAMSVIGFTALLMIPVGANALPWGLVAGELVQGLWWGAWLLNEGIDIEPNFSASPATRQIGRDLFPILGGEVLVAANLVVDKGFASTLEIGSVAILEFADRARIIPTTLVASTLAMVSFATWSNLHADGKHREARANMDLSLRWILLLASPILAAMYLSRIVLIRTLFERGLFTFQNSLDTAQVLAAYIPGLLFTLMGILTIRAHIIERNLRIIFVLGAASVMANFTLNQMLVGPFGLIGLATSTTVNEILITTIYILCLVHLLPPNIFQRWFSSILIAILGFTLSLVLENLLGIPQAWNDPRLWLSLFSCGALLLVSLFLIRQEGLPMTHRSA